MIINFGIALSDENYDQVKSESADTSESVAINGVKEITASDRPVEDHGDPAATETTATQVGLAETDDKGTYRPEDAPTAAETISGRPHSQTFLDKMQGLAFQAADPG